MINDYEAILGRSHKYYIKVKCKKLLEILKEHYLDTKSLTCLDVGCGTGEAEELLSKNFQMMVGVDRSNFMIDEAIRKKVDGCEFVCSDASELPFKDNVFDVSFSFSLMHHIPKDKRSAVVREIDRVTKKGGLVLFFEHNPLNPVTQYKVGTCSLDKGCRLLFLQEIERLCRMNNITVLRKEFLIFFPPMLSSLQPLENSLNRIPFGGQYVVIGVKD